MIEIVIGINKIFAIIKMENRLKKRDDHEGDKIKRVKPWKSQKEKIFGCNFPFVNEFSIFPEKNKTWNGPEKLNGKPSQKV